MTSSTSKKVTVQRFDREPLHGFVHPQSYLQADRLELLSVSGSILTVLYEEVKMVRFVRDFVVGKPFAERQSFQTRPKSEGLWVRMQFRDGDSLEGVLPNNLLLFEPAGFNAVPPDAAGNTQRVFIPRVALNSIQVLGVIGSPLRARKTVPEKQQIGLFEEAPAATASELGKEPVSEG